MSKKILEISRYNWGFKGPGSWNKMKWELFDDLSIIRTDEYLGFEPGHGPNKEEVHKYTMEQEELDSLMDNVVRAKDIDTVVDGCDGEAWAFVEYNDDGSVKWSRDAGYVYGLKPLEEISESLLAIE